MYNIHLIFEIRALSDLKRFQQPDGKTLFCRPIITILNVVILNDVRISQHIFLTLLYTIEYLK